MHSDLKVFVEETIKSRIGNSVALSWDALPGTGSTSLRAIVWWGSGDRRRGFVVKAYRIPDKPFEESVEQARREFVALNLLSSFCTELWHTPQPVAFLREHATIVMEYFPGVNINSLFWREVRSWLFARTRLHWFLKLLKDVAAIIHSFNGITKPPHGIPFATPSWYEAFLDEQLESLASFGVDSTIIDRIRSVFRHALPSLVAPSEVCLQHTDLYFNNLLYDGRVYCVIDLPNLVKGSRYWDISHLVMSLEHYRIFRNVDGVVIDRCEEVFLSGFVYEKQLFDAMQLVHASFSLKISFMVHSRGISNIFKGDAPDFYLNKIRVLLKNLGAI